MTFKHEWGAIVVLYRGQSGTIDVSGKEYTIYSFAKPAQRMLSLDTRRYVHRQKTACRVTTEGSYHDAAAMAGFAANQTAYK